MYLINTINQFCLDLEVREVWLPSTKILLQIFSLLVKFCSEDTISKKRSMICEITIPTWGDVYSRQTSDSIHPVRSLREMLASIAWTASNLWGIWNKVILGHIQSGLAGTLLVCNKCWMLCLCPYTVLAQN